MPSRIIATCLALVAFAAAMVAGLLSDNPATTTIWRALVAMVVCWFAGRIIGEMADRALNEHLEQYKAEHPIPEDLSQLPASDDGGDASPQQATTEDSAVADAGPARTAA